MLLFGINRVKTSNIVGKKILEQSSLLKVPNTFLLKNLLLCANVTFHINRIIVKLLLLVEQSDRNLSKAVLELLNNDLER